MGNVRSSASTTGERTTERVTSESETMDDASVSFNKEESEIVEEFHDTIDEEKDEARAKAKEEEMEEFKKELKLKREQRREILNRHRAEKDELEKSLEKERQAKLKSYESNRELRELLMKNNIDIPEKHQASNENSDITNTIVQMREEFDKLKANNIKLRRDLADSNSALQKAYSDIADLSAQNTESIKQIRALKDVISVSKTMINLREQQLNELKNKLNEIERSLADREANMLSSDLRQEYERQLQNIRTLRALYEERARLAEVTRQGLLREIEEQKRLKQEENNKCKELTTKVEELERKVDELHERIENKNNQIASCQDETRGLKAEMAVVNKLFSQVLLGYKTKQDLDKLVHRLEENHGLLTHMAEREDGSEASSALPKLLLELVSQVDDEEENNDLDSKFSNDAESLATDGPNEELEVPTSVNASAEEIVENLPKVWRVLMELLSHQSSTEENTSEKVTTCYKSVETKSGPVLVPSVSQTYIRLKDLIIEKLALIKEVNHMKQLNGHLETRLEEQERRLCLVTTELSKTWHVVGRLRRHHHQLHTHEKILKYELQQKRKLLNELKEELEYCREKWEQAREKNSQSEKDLKQLRTEFSNRKTKTSATSLNNSAESGYSDERPSDDSSESNDESEYVTEPLIRSRKKNKKSFETIVDSSTDFNLAAEREDPASDMLDVADLPLDTQDGEDNHESCISDSCNSESILKSEKNCVETEDEVGDITNESCTEDTATAENCETSDTSPVELNFVRKDQEQNDLNIPTCSDAALSLTNTPIIDPASILRSIKLQNERLAKKEKRLEKLEKSGAALLKQTQTTAEISNQINSTLDHLINRPTSSKQAIDYELQALHDGVKKENTSPIHSAIDHPIKIDDQNKDDKKTKKEVEPVEGDIDTTQSIDSEIELFSVQNQNQNSTSNKADSGCSTELTSSSYSKEIVDDVNLQNEQLTSKEEILENVESGCSEFVTEISNNLNSCDEEIIEQLDNPLKEHHGENSNVEIESPSRDSSEPSTSSEIDHEARFAARDLRLKRLEEQTKSLVNKVNKTTTKGMKINYKLEELHNIYGSESSRAGTPSEDNDEEPPKDADETND